MNLGVAYNQILGMLNKTKEGAMLSPSLFDSAMLYAVNLFQSLECGLEPKEPNDGPYWQRTRRVTDAMVPLLVTLGEDGNQMLPVNSNGYASYPSDFFAFSSLVFPYVFNVGNKAFTEEREILDLTDEQFNHRLRSVRKFPSMANPISTARNGKIRFMPTDLKKVKLTYIRNVKAPVYDYNVLGNITIYLPPGTVHNGTNKAAGTPSASVEIEYLPAYHQQVVNYAYDYCARNLKRPEAIALAQQAKNNGE